MTEALKTYSPEQAQRISQFDRATKVLQKLDAKQDFLDSGAMVVVFDANNPMGGVFDKQGQTVVRGMKTGLFNELHDMGLGAEVKDIMERNKPDEGKLG